MMIFKIAPTCRCTVVLIVILNCLTRDALSQNLTITPRPQCANSPVSLTCKEFQFAAIEWRNGSTIISSMNGRYSFNNNRTVLVIQNITHYDNGSVITCGDANNSSISNPVTILVYELLDRPKDVRFTNALNSFMVTWKGVCDDVSVDKSPVTGYNISWYNLERDILGSLLVPSLCGEDSEFYVANFTSELIVELVSVSAENVCGIGEATNIIIKNSLIAISPERYAVGQIGQTLTISCISNYNNSTLQWFQGQVTGNDVQTERLFSLNQSIVFSVTQNYSNSIFYCTFENHPIYYNVLTELIVLTKPLSFTINDYELPTVSIINNISSPELHRLLCIGTEGNRELQLHVNTTDISGGMPISSQNYSAAIEITIKTQNLSPLFISTLTCTSIESGEAVSLILTSSSLYVHVIVSHVVIDSDDTGPVVLRYIVALNSTGYSNNLDQITSVWVQFTNVNGSVMNFTTESVNDVYNLTVNENGYDLVLLQIDSQRTIGQYTLFVVARDGVMNNAASITVTFDENVPAIATDPENMTIHLNSNDFSLSLSCKADGATSYYWERQNNSVPSYATGGNTNMLTIHPLQPGDAGNYRCVATNAFGSTFSQYASLVVNVEPPFLIASPSSQSIALTQTAIFTCNATGYNISHQWTVESGSLPNKTFDTVNTDALVIPDVRASDINTYVCQVSNEGGIIVSENASLTVIGLPVVTVIPSSHNVEVTHTVIFTATASGVGSVNFTYQWKHNGSFITKQNGTTLTITNIMERDGGNYSCLVTNMYGNTMLSNVVTLIVSRNLPVITTNPVDKMVNSDSSTTSVSFTCEAEGATSYIWERQDGDISSDATGVNTTVLTINNIQPGDTGYYRCVASNASGNNFSKYAALELFGCAMETDKIYGLNWPNAKSGELVIVKCSAFSDTNNATRLCNNNNIWDKIDVSNCESDLYSILLLEVQELSNGNIPGSNTAVVGNRTGNRTGDQREIFEAITNLVTLLSYSTTPTQNRSILPLDIGNTNNILSSLLMVSEMEPSILRLQNFVNDTANVFSNILDANNTIGWIDLLTINESSSQQLLQNSERFSLQLANHTMFSGIRNIDIVQDNIVISAKAQMDDISDIIFPSQDTMLNSNFVDASGMPYASIVIPSSILKSTSSLHNGSVAVGSVLYQTISSLLPNYTINNRNDTRRVASMVLSTQILGGASFVQDQYPIELNFQLTQNVNNSRNFVCGFFDENVNGSGWSTSGLTVDFMNDTHIRCLSTHLTTFAVLLDLTGNTVKKISQTEIDLLNIFTYIGCGISLICLALTIIILLLFFKSLLKDLHYFVHFNLSIALFMGLVIFLAGIDHATENKIACTIVAALLHYFFTAVFTWMMCEGLMIYLLLVKVFKTNITNKRWPFLLLGWGTPVLIVGIAVGIAHDGYGNEDYCWLSIEKGTIWGFVGPVLLFIIINLIFLIMGVKATLRGRISKYQATSMHEGELNKLKIAKWLLRDTLFLLPMFGITWVFGLLAFNENLSVFAWLFVFFNTTQGFLIFLLYIMRQKKVRERLYKLFCSHKKPMVFTVKSIPMFNLMKSHGHKRIDPSEITVEVNRSVADLL